MHTALTVRSALLGLVVLLTWALTACEPPRADPEGLARSVGASASAGAGTASPPRGAEPTTPTPGDDRRRWVESTLAGMTLEQRVGQLFMGYAFGTSGDDLDPVAVAGNQRVYGVDTAAEAVRRYGLGGVIYFDAGGAGPGALPDNVVDSAQVGRLSADLRAAGGEVPLLVAADQEQGTVVRVSDGVTLLPGQLAQGADGRPGDVRDAALVTGSDLRALGIDVDFAPDADVNVAPANPVIGERSFGDDPAAVATLTSAAVAGYRAAGVAAAAKHFPGHGSTTVDSHLGLPEVTQTREQLDAVDLAPFRAAIEADVPMVMVGHLLVPALDAEAPASLSQPVVGGLLRDELGFDGVIVTDALNMAAVTDRYSPGEVAVRALLAGNDLLLMPPRFVEARDAVLAAVRDGRVPAGRVDESARRVLGLKWQLGHVTPEPPPTNPGEVAARIASRSVTLLDSTCASLPLAPGERVAVFGSGRAAQLLRDELAARGVPAVLNPDAATADAAGGPDPAVPDPAVPDPAADPAADPAVPDPGGPDAGPAMRVELGRAGAAASVAAAGSVPGDHRIAVATGAPYQPPEAGLAAWLATYSTDPASMASLAAVLTGQALPAGRLPIETLGADGRPPLPRGSGQSGFVAC